MPTMPTSNQRPFFVFSWSLLLLVLLGCQQNEPSSTPKKTAKPTLETAQRISQVTAGVISSRDLIRVRFSSESVAQDQIGQPLKKSIFAFDPPVVGAASWEDRRTLIFTPNRPWPLRQQYSGSLDLETLFPQEKIPPLDFQFLVAGREVASLKAGFSLQDPDQPQQLVYDGELLLTEKTELRLVEEAASLTMSNQAVDLYWQELDEGRRFAFESQLLRRDASKRHFVLRLDGAALELSGDHVHPFTLEPLREMRLQKVTPENGEEPRIQLAFSDEIDMRQDLRGLVGVDPPLDIEIKAMGDKATVTGPFAPGQSYDLTVHPGIASRWGTRTTQAEFHQVAFTDLKPQLRFGKDGAFLPGQRQGRLRFWTLNLKKVRIEVKKVFESNLGQFLQTERLESSRERRNRFNDHYVNRVGVEVFNDSLEIGTDRNRWLEHELDLDRLLQADGGGLYLVALRFTQPDMLYGDESQAEENRRRRRWDSSDPYSRAYVHAHGYVFKPLVVSDIGLLHKRTDTRHIVWTTRIGDTAPLAGVEVTLRSYQNQILAQGVSDAAGRIEFAATNESVFYIEAQANGQRSLLKPDETAWNLSTFDTGGEDVTGGRPRAFIYTERGVYRPGDTVHLGLIVRHADDTFPDDHPVDLKVFNARGQLVNEQTLRQGRDGFYAFSFSTRPEDPTGNWRAQIQAGSSRFDHPVKVETVVPFKLKIEIEPDKPNLAADDTLLGLRLGSTYLFGAPAAGLKAEIDVRLQHLERRFESFKAFMFTDESRSYRDADHRAFTGTLDAQGKTRLRWPLPRLDAPPSAVRALVQTRVFEPGGRPNRRNLVLEIDPYTAYVGIRKPEFDYGYARTGAELELPVIALDPQGKQLSGRRLSYRIWRGSRHWWWEYDDRQSYLRRFKSASSTELVMEGATVSALLPVPLRFTPEAAGEYLVEVQDGDKGHTAAFFMRAYAWGAGAVGDGGEATLAMRSDHEIYAPGDEALVRFPAPAQGSVLFTLEKGGRVLEERRYELSGEAGEFSIPIQIDSTMLPGVYASVALLQPYGQTLNDRPLRTYGVLPLKVEDPLTHRRIVLDLPTSLRPEEPFSVNISSSDGKPTQFTLAVVDEGLLALTDFSTPAPWKNFYRKQRLGVQSHDIFSLFIGAVAGDVFKTFSIGGDVPAAARLGRLPGPEIDPDKRDRFEAVSMFKGPLHTDEQGRATVDFDMPNYIGAVRVMAVAAQGRRYGSAERTVPVKTELLLLPSLPRFLGPEDSLKAAVSVFALQDSLGAVKVSIKTQGPLLPAGETEKTLYFTGQGTRELVFDLATLNAVGQARVVFEAQAAGQSFRREVSIEVRPAAPRLYTSQTKEVKPGAATAFDIPAHGLEGTNRAHIRVQRLNYNFSNRLYRLLRYPYGCIEQTVSAAFPQLYLKDFIAPRQRPEVGAEIDRHLNAAITRLRRFQLSDGSFSYWPGSSSASTWGGLYAGHFLVEARSLGYHVPDTMLDGWRRYQHSQSLLSREALMVRVYRVYLLALAGDAAVGPMNLLKENSLDEMRPVERWLLAAAYRLAGMARAADDIIAGVGTQVKAYREFAHTYGSALRDRGLILNAALTLERTNTADELADVLGLALSGDGWYSTQETAAVLLGLGKYLKSQQIDASVHLAGWIELPDGERLDFDTDEFGAGFDIEKGFGGPVQVHLATGHLGRAFATLDWDGIPLKNELPDEEKNIELDVEWLDEDGQALDPSRIKQGTAFWGHFRVGNLGNRNSIEEIALAQLLPAGWEIENIRIAGEAVPAWMKNWKLQREEYLDIRDEGAVWFFDLHGDRSALNFVLKLNAVTPGTFTLPPTTVEAMYDRQYRARRSGQRVVVEK
jgi:alpha-2-macroglobulin